MSLFLRSPHAHARILGIDTARLQPRCPASSPIVTGAGSRARRREAAADLRGLPPCRTVRRRRRRRATRSPSISCASSAKPSRRSSPNSREEARDALEAIDVRYDPLPSVVDSAAAVSRRRRTGMAGGDRQHRGGDSPWRRCRDGEGLRERRARRRAGSRQSAAGAMSDRAARLARELRHRERTHHAPREQPDADRPARHAVRRGARHRARQGAGARGRRRRRLRDEDRAVSGGRRAGVLRARLETAAQVVRRAHRRVSRGLARSRRDQQGRVGAGCVRSGAGAPRVLARQPGCVRDARRRRDPVAHRTVGVDEHLRHSDSSTSASRACSRTRARRAPTAAPDVPRRSTSSNA